MSVIGTPVESTPGGVTSTTLSIVVPTGGGVIYVHADGTANATSVSSSINGAFTSLQTPGQIGVSGLFPTLWGINASAGTHTVTISSTTANSIYYTMGLSVSQATLNLSNSAQSSSAGTWHQEKIY